MSSINISSTSVTFTRDNVQRSQTTGYPTIGTIISWAGKNTDKLTGTPYLLCDGRSLNKNSYPDLFTVIGYRYGGSGDNYVGTIFKDGGTPITEGSAPFTGVFAPEGAVEAVLIIFSIILIGTSLSEK